MSDAGANNDFVGVLLPPQMASVQPRFEGRVLTVNARLGQPVKTGDVLVTLDPREAQHNLAMAQAQVKVAKADTAKAWASSAAAAKKAKWMAGTVTLNDGKQMGLSSGLDVDQARAEAQATAAAGASAAAHVDELKAHVNQLQLALEETQIVAPFDGVITALNFEPGMTAHVGDVVVRVVGGVGLRARIAVPEDASHLMTLPRARISVEGRVLFAAIDQRALEVEPASRMFFIEGNVELSQGSCGGDCAMLAGRAVRAAMLEPGGDR